MLCTWLHIFAIDMRSVNNRKLDPVEAQGIRLRRATKSDRYRLEWHISFMTSLAAGVGDAGGKNQMS